MKATVAVLLFTASVFAFDQRNSRPRFAEAFNSMIMFVSGSFVGAGATLQILWQHLANEANNNIRSAL